MVSTEQKALLDLVKVGATEVSLVSVAVFDADWTTVFDLACKQGVVCLAWHGLEILYKNGVDSCPAEVKLQWYGRNKQVQAENKKMFDKVAAFADAVAPLRLVVLKGADYARYWSNPLWREFGDLDCMAIDDGSKVDLRSSSVTTRQSSSELDSALAAPSVQDGAKLLDEKAQEIGLKVEDADYKHTHITYNGLTIENHHCFTSFAGSKEGRVLEEELRRLFAQNSSKSFKFVQGCDKLLSSNNEFTAVFMIAHAQNHFFTEGIALRHILDWHFFLTKEGSDADWSIIKPVLEKTGLKTFAVLLTQICNKYFDLRCNVFATDLSCSDELVETFLDDVFADKYDANDRRWHKMLLRMWQRFVRNVRFAELNKMSVGSSVWKWIAYASFFHRKPEL